MIAANAIVGTAVRNKIPFLICFGIGAAVLVGSAHAANFDPKAATDAYLATITGDAKAKSDAYFEGGYWLILWDALWAIAVAAILLFTRLSAGIRNLVERGSSWRAVQTFVYAMLYTIVTAAFTSSMIPMAEISSVGGIAWRVPSAPVYSLFSESFPEMNGVP